MLRNLKAGEEIIFGQWECGAYVPRAAEHSAHVSVSFSILFLLSFAWVYRLYSIPSSPAASPQELMHLHNQVENIFYLEMRIWDCALTEMGAFVDGQERFINLFQQNEESPLENHTYVTSGHMRKGGGERCGDMRW